MTETVSLVVCTKDRWSLLETCLISVLNQPVVPEIILVNDNSTIKVPRDFYCAVIVHKNNFRHNWLI